MTDDAQAEPERLRFYANKYATYGTSIVAFSIVQGVAFMLLLLTECTIRLGLEDWRFLTGVLVGAAFTCGLYLWALRVCHIREVSLTRALTNGDSDDLLNVIRGLNRIHMWAIVLSNVLVGVAAFTHYYTTVHLGIRIGQCS